MTLKYFKLPTCQPQVCPWLRWASTPQLLLTTGPCLGHLLVRASHGVVARLWLVHVTEQATEVIWGPETKAGYFHGSSFPASFLKHEEWIRNDKNGRSCFGMWFHAVSAHCSANFNQGTANATPRSWPVLHLAVLQLGWAWSAFLGRHDMPRLCWSPAGKGTRCTPGSSCPC